MGGERRPRAVVIGAGIGGLSAAIHLAAAGGSVTVVERAPEPGGKAGTEVFDGVTFDTGPSVLTMPDVFDGLLRVAGTSLDAELELVRPKPAFRYAWPDGAVLDVEVDPDATLAAVHRAFGAEAEAELAGFLAYAAGIWRVAEPRFVRGAAPSPWALLSFAAVRDSLAIDPLRSMAAAITRRVSEPHLRDLLFRYATYAGSDPRRAPATLNCIAHVELALGGFGVRGGIGKLVQVLVRAAERLGVELRFGVGVDRVRIADGRATGVDTEQGTLDADVVVANGDIGDVIGRLCGGRALPPPTSTSGWTAVIAGRLDRRPAHLVSFPQVYGEEFADLFDRQRTPEDPTVYVCAQRACHLRDTWPCHEPLFVMVNAPAEGVRVGAAEPEDFEGLEARVHARLVGERVIDPGDRVVWRRTPSGLAARFPGSGGALYGAALAGPLGPLRRPGNRVPGIRGMYAAGGTTHPGGGMPLAALSGRAAALAAQEDGTWASSPG